MIKFRLIKKGKIVGYEWHKIGFDKTIYIIHSESENFDIKREWISHNAKDRYFGKDDNQEDLYENDTVEIWNDAEIDEKQESTIDWKWGGFFVDCDKINPDYDSYLLEILRQELYNIVLTGNIHQTGEQP